jgi:DNA-binding MarR family transcriptional regulator
LGLTKGNLLTYLVHAGEADAQDVAREFGVGYSVAAMALLRLVRQGLASRHRNAERSAYRYRPSERGQSRLMNLKTGRENTG